MTKAEYIQLENVQRHVYSLIDQMGQPDTLAINDRKSWTDKAMSAYSRALEIRDCLNAIIGKQYL